MPPPTLESRLALRQKPTQQPFVMHQTWQKLLFLHWEIDPAAIQRTLPAGLTVDTFDGRAFVGLVPFFMCNIRPRFLPSVPGISHFLETNVRTYVYDQNGTAGVWFYSLDANQWLAVQLARFFFKLPYFWAQMHSPQMSFWGLRPAEQAVTYHTQRRNVPQIDQFVYQPAGPTFYAEPGTLEFFLAERYILFATPRPGQLATGQVYHTPYPLAVAQLSQWSHHLLKLAGFQVERPPDYAHFSPGVEVLVYPIQPVK